MTIKDENQNEYEININKAAGVGGQGKVYFVENNPRLVIKAIVKSDGETILKSMKRYELYRRKVLGVIARANEKNLASPICMLEEPYCGYVMRFMEGMRPIESIMIPKGKDLKEFYMETGGLLRRYRVLREIARVLKGMYDNGLVYSDISPKNIFISGNVSGYEAWLIDVDNLHYEGEESSIVGTPMYRSPEVFCGCANTLKGDVYSFALLAFELLTLSKPFVGDYKEEDEDDWGVDGETSNDFYSKVERGEIPFVGAENNKLNRQVSGIPLKYVVNEEILKLFRKTFGEGRRNPAARPSIALWFSALNTACMSLENATYKSAAKEDCFKFDRYDEGTIAVTVYDISYVVTENEDGLPLYETREQHFRHKVYINEMTQQIQLSGLLFDPKARRGAVVTVRRKKKEFRFDSSQLDVKLQYSWRKKNTLDGLVIETVRAGLSVRRLEFCKEMR